MQQTYFFGLLSYEKRGKRNNSANLGLKKKGRSCCSEKCLMFRLCGNQRSFWSYLWAVWRWVCICNVALNMECIHWLWTARLVQTFHSAQMLCDQFWLLLFQTISPNNWVSQVWQAKSCRVSNLIDQSQRQAVTSCWSERSFWREAVLMLNSTCWEQPQQGRVRQSIFSAPYICQVTVCSWSWSYFQLFSLWTSLSCDPQAQACASRASRKGKCSVCK